MKRVDVVYAFIVDVENKRVLMVKNKKYNNWTLPGGSVEKGETLEQATIREVWEETGLNCTVKDLLVVNEVFREKENNHVLFFTFQGITKDKELKIQDTAGILDIAWIDFETANKYMPYYIDGIEGLLKRSVKYTFQGIQK